MVVIKIYSYGALYFVFGCLFWVSKIFFYEFVQRSVSSGITRNFDKVLRFFWLSQAITFEAVALFQFPLVQSFSSVPLRN